MNTQEAVHFFHPDDREKLASAIERALTEGEPYDMEVRYITATRKNLLTRTICKPQVSNGKVFKLRGTFQVIIEQRDMQEELPLFLFYILL